ncbi:Metallo-dependent phosphatase-like protein [Radiomyces spectabilis]|uniref:Metallo-dependent phosphatase-like protein n=1 Tax=Radiomyces spectabilis TaxID=64574 RepID=UPI002220C7F3|nr:Metallo-dependent phosphatase-like protein [Radiomyces spectabilis]KAI8374173.1 Metallo-dependent phosphatase-like protein [Radiomyces spectabilis]
MLYRIIIFGILFAFVWYLQPIPFEQLCVQTRAIMSYTAAWHHGQVRPPAPFKRYGYFLHITDFHMDEDYVPGASVRSDCHSLPALYHQMKQPKVAGLLGAPGERCDAPVELIQQTLNWIGREWGDKLDFVIWTGDNARHDWDKKNRRNRKQVYNLNQRATDMMIEAFWRPSRRIPLIPCIGNNDVYPHNRLDDNRTDADLLTFYERLWRPWIPVDQRPVFRQGGYFAVDIAPRLRVLSLNTMYFFSRNKAVKNCVSEGAARDHIRWFEDELAKARRDGVTVYVMGHVPPSPRDYRNTCLREYLRIASAYTDVIASHLYGHLNMDHFLLYDGRDYTTDSQTPEFSLLEDDIDDDSHGHFDVNRNVGKYVDWLRSMYEAIDDIEDMANLQSAPLVAIQVIPSILPVYYPGVRVYRYEINDNPYSQRPDQKPYGTLLGYTQYYANITDWEEKHPNEPLEYQIEYETGEEYGLKDLTSESFFQLAKTMVQGDLAGDRLWSNYVRNMFIQTMNDTFLY